MVNKIDKYRNKLRLLELERRDKRLGNTKEINVFKNLKPKPKGNSAFKEKYHKYLKSDEWLGVRMEMLRYYNFTCNRCKKKKHPKQLQVHHLTYKNIFHEEAEDLEVVCKKCHEKEHKIFK